MLDNKGQVEKWVGMNIDIDARKRAEALLCESELRQRRLMENVPQLIWRAASEGSWTWASPQWAAYTGQSKSDGHGGGWFDALHPADRERTRAAWRDAPGNGLFQVDCRIRHGATGNYSWFQLRAVPVHADDNGPSEWFGTCTDIDDQVQSREALKRSGEDLERQVAERTGELTAAETALRQHEKLTAIGQLTGGIAHDFNNLLQALGNSLDMLRLRMDRGERTGLQLYIDRAEHTVERAAALTHRLLTFSRQQDLEPRALNLDLIVRGMEDLIRRTVGPAIQVELQLQNGRWLTWCDPNQLENAR